MKILREVDLSHEASFGAEGILSISTNQRAEQTAQRRTYIEWRVEPVGGAKSKILNSNNNNVYNYNLMGWCLWIASIASHCRTRNSMRMKYWENSLDPSNSNKFTFNFCSYFINILKPAEITQEGKSWVSIEHNVPWFDDLGGARVSFRICFAVRDDQESPWAEDGVYYGKIIAHRNE